MTQEEKERAIACIKLAIELAGDGGPMPFTEKEYELMYSFWMKNSTMTQLAIKGHPTRGKEVIEILEMLGGRNVSPFLKGDALHQFYHIRESNNEIICFTYSTYKDGYKVFTLEEFEEKFPYKVGDKVTLDKYPCVITGMNWDCDDNDIIYYVKGADFSKGVYSKDKDLQPYKEETMGEKEPEPKAPILSNRYDYAEGKCGYVIPDGYEFDSIKEGFKTEIIIRPIKPQYPKTYEECCAILGHDVGRVISFDTQTCKTDTLFENFYELYICRNAYWKIAGEEMGLDKPWKPDFTNIDNCYLAIKTCKGEISLISTLYIEDCILVFPTKEMRDAFFENFKDLIENCKELL